MGRPWSRKRGGADGESVESEHLDADAHAWWAQAEVDQAWKPKTRPAPKPEPTRDILAEHFGDDWRTNFGVELTEEERAQQLAEAQGSGDEDPYAILEIDPSATWDEIVTAHRQQARVHHPDRLFGQSDDEKAEGEDRIRVINAAYQELRVRRGM